MEIIQKTHLEIIKLNKELTPNKSESNFDISVLSNITLNKLKDILEFPLRSYGINAHVRFGNYDNIVQDSFTHNKSDVVIIHQELKETTDRIIKNQITYNDSAVELIITEVKSQIDLILQNLCHTKLVIFNRYSSHNFFSTLNQKKAINTLTTELNSYLEIKSDSNKNVRLCDIDRITFNLGLKDSLDYRSYSAFKDLYKTLWLQYYTEEIQHLIYAVTGKVKKALIVDCDNTLWKGVLGEDGFEHIEMSMNTKGGEPFYYVQNVISQLSKKGVLICLCSKNNEDDVNHVINEHPDFSLNNDQITIKKVNWNDKATNIREISNELNIGLDSLIFLDDSDFEINLVKESIPEVLTFQVPKNTSHYPDLMNNLSNYFYRYEITEDDVKKAQEYKKQAIRQQQKSSFNNIEEYIKSLDIEINISKNDIAHLSRMEQMSQKTNQFNFTTIRYTSSQIEEIIKHDENHIYCINVKDKFGDSGITGMIITKVIDSKTCEIDTFLMSCRVIGRYIEHAFLKYVINDCKKSGIEQVRAAYIKTKKNQQVEMFYSNLGFNLISKNNEKNEYLSKIENIKLKDVDYIRSN
jgi:FkbH-like protein